MQAFVVQSAALGLPAADARLKRNGAGSSPTAARP